MTDWARDPQQAEVRVLSVVAIGGMGKSALTWKWFTHSFRSVLPDFNGSVWWSFYESDAHFENFIVRTLAYVSGQGKTEIRQMPFHERQESLLALLDQRPFLLVLDGLERILVAYARMDAPQLTDEELDAATAHALTVGERSLGLPESRREKERLRRTTDERAGRFLVRLLKLRCSRVLISTRLGAAELESNTGQPLPGAAVLPLLGLSDADALGLWRANQLEGDVPRLLPFFNRFQNHPLVLRALAGEVAGFRPAPGDFGRWLEAHPELRVTDLDLCNVRNHILKFALHGLPESQAVVLRTLAAFRMPANWAALADTLVGTERPLPELSGLARALGGLENRGLVGWDRGANRYDLHPVIRGIAWQSVDAPERRAIFGRLRDYFQRIPEVDQFLKPRQLDELTPAIELCHALVRLEDYDEAHEIFADRLFHTMKLGLGLSRPCAELLELFFPAGASRPPALSTPEKRAYLSGALASCYQLCGEPGRVLDLVPTSASASGDRADWPASSQNVSALRFVGRLREAELAVRSRLRLGFPSSEFPDPELAESYAWLDLGLLLATRGDDAKADRVLEVAYRRLTGRGDFCGGGLADMVSAQAGIWCGDFEFAAARADDAMKGVSYMHAAELELVQVLRVQGEAALGLGQMERAGEILRDALARARSVASIQDEIPLSIALAKLEHRQGSSDSARALLEEIDTAVARGPYPLFRADAANVLAEIEKTSGRREEAIEAARRAFTQAWCDGRPYGYAAGILKARALLTELSAGEPDLPNCDESRLPAMPPLDLDGTTI